MYQLVVIGASLGGLHALRVVLNPLPASFPLAVVIVHHRKSGAEDTLSALLQEHTHLPVKEAEDKDPLERGRIYLAPADYHLLVERGALALSTEAPVNYAMPSIDVLFESAAEAYGARVIGVILTGANDDGARGLAKIKDRGGIAIVQDPNTAEARTMPEAAIAATRVDVIASLREIGEFLKGAGSR